MISFDLPDRRFNFRVAGVCIYEGHVLLTSADHEDYWILPGGRLELLEDTRTTLHREMAEVLGFEAEVGKLLWVVENFFVFSGKSYHEVAFVYEISPRDPALLERSWTHATTDGDVPIELRWFPLENLEALNLQPAFLKMLLHDPPSNTEYVVIRE